MKAMLLAAGKGERLSPLTDRVPKCMVPIGGKPVLEHTLEWMRRFGIRETMVNLHHLGDVVRGYFGDGSRLGLRLHYSPEEKLLGTAGAVKRAAWFFDEPFLVWYGDNLSCCNLWRLLARHRNRGGIATLALYRRPDPLMSGIVEIDNQDRVLRFREKPQASEVFSNWINAGIMIIEPAAFNRIPEGPCDFGRDVFPQLLAAGERIYGYCLEENEGLWWIDTPEDLQKVQEVWRSPRPKAVL